mgnify:FL=1
MNASTIDTIASFYREKRAMSVPDSKTKIEPQLQPTANIKFKPFVAADAEAC